MNIVFKDSFAKSLKKLKERDLKDKILHLIELIEKANSISEIPGIKKLSGYQFYYRIRIGDYRIGVFCDSSDSLTLVTFHKRNDFYKKFP